LGFEANNGRRHCLLNGVPETIFERAVGGVFSGGAIQIMRMKPGSGRGKKSAVGFHVLLAGSEAFGEKIREGGMGKVIDDQRKTRAARWVRRAVKLVAILF
jgi:hypothetical protein